MVVFRPHSGCVTGFVFLCMLCINSARLWVSDAVITHLCTGWVTAVSCGAAARLHFYRYVGTSVWDGYTHRLSALCV